MKPRRKSTLTGFGKTQLCSCHEMILVLRNGLAKVFYFTGGCSWQTPMRRFSHHLSCSRWWAYSFKRLVLIPCISQAKFGVTITQDTCLHKVRFNSILRFVRLSHFDLSLSDQDYTQQCPVGWDPNVEGWCKPPKTYTVTFQLKKNHARCQCPRRILCVVQGPCRRQNFFGQRELGHEYSNPASKVCFKSTRLSLPPRYNFSFRSAGLQTAMV